MWVNLGDGYQTVVTPGFGPQRKTIPTEPPFGGSIKQKNPNDTGARPQKRR
jgi:hypothetical protein